MGINWLIRGRWNKINKIEVRCKGTYVDKYGNKRSCNRMFFIGSPGFDIHGNPKELVLRCPKCGNDMIITCKIDEKVVVKLKEWVMPIIGRKDKDF